VFFFFFFFFWEQNEFVITEWNGYSPGHFSPSLAGSPFVA
jgi:hypothetical protein